MKQWKLTRKSVQTMNLINKKENRTFLMYERKRVDALLADRRASIKHFKIEKKELKTLTASLTNQKDAQIIVQNIAQLIQQKAHERIEGVVSKCLEAVFGNAYGFKIRFERKRGRTEANLILLKDGHEIEDGLNADSGGVVEVAAFALRLACIVLAKPALKRIVIMDEPFRNLDAGNRENMRVLLEELSEDFKVQFILVTHEEAFHAGKVIKI
jgi:DNA repair exonuclease SbcCD ATPase subunit